MKPSQLNSQEIPFSADAIVRQLFAESIGKNGPIKELVERIADMEDDIDWTLTLGQSKKKWRLARRIPQAA